MGNLEKVEKIMARADVTYEEAKTVLEECEWDVLEALLKLEAQGKTKKNVSFYSTAGEKNSDIPMDPEEVAESYRKYESNKQEEKSGFFHTLKNCIKYIFAKGCENKFCIHRHGEKLFDIPVIILVLLMICFFWILLILMAVSLFFGYSYSFEGAELGKESVNNAMKQASEAAENVKNDFEKKSRDAQDKKGE